jgi:hypothetical protein
MALEPTAGPEFSLESLAVEDDRVVVQGRWYGVVGRRFVRPTLSLDGQRRVIATLEHKPWAAAEGDLWVAAFPHSGDAFRTAALEVAPNVIVDLTPGAAADKAKASQAKAREQPRAPRARDALLEARRKAEREREDLRSHVLHVTQQRDEVIEERDKALAARDAAVRQADDRERRAREQAQAEVRRVEAELEAARKEYDATYLRAVRAEQALAEATKTRAHREAAAAEDHQRLRTEQMPPPPPPPDFAPVPARTPRSHHSSDSTDSVAARVAAAALVILLIIAFVAFLDLIV